MEIVQDQAEATPILGDPPMYIEVTDDGGRRIVGDTGWGRWSIHVRRCMAGKRLVILNEWSVIIGHGTIEFLDPSLSVLGPNGKEAAGYIQQVDGDGRVIAGEASFGKWEFHFEHLDAETPLQVLEGSNTRVGNGFIEFREPAPPRPEPINPRGAIGRVVRGAIGLVKAELRIDVVPNDVYEKRLAICKACEEATPCHGGTSRLCCGPMIRAITGGKTCGCVLDAHARGRTSRCPLDKPKWTEWSKLRAFKRSLIGH